MTSGPFFHRIGPLDCVTWTMLLLCVVIGETLLLRTIWATGLILNTWMLLTHREPSR